MADEAPPKPHAPKGPLKAKPDPMATSNPMARRCTATNRRQLRCERPAIPGGTVCRYHGGAAPQVQLAALERLRQLQDPAIVRLAELIVQKEFPSTSMAAV